MKKVIVVGGGVAGLSAALELAELGYSVTVFEGLMWRIKLSCVAAAHFGGKARSQFVDVGEGKRPLPGEHGFRVFVNFYEGVIDTLRRTPTEKGRSVFGMKPTMGFGLMNSVPHDRTKCFCISAYMWMLFCTQIIR